MDSWELKRLIPGCFLFFAGAIWTIGLLINGSLHVSWISLSLMAGGAYFLVAVYTKRYEKKKELTGKKTSHGELISDIHFAVNQNQWSKKQLGIVCLAIFCFMLGIVILHQILGWLNSIGYW